MGDYLQDKLLGMINHEEVRSLLSFSSSGVSIANPLLGAVLGSFKEAASLADDVKFQHIINGLASGLNQEKSTYDLQHYIRANNRPFSALCSM